MTIELQRNAFKHAIAAGKLQIGLWSSLCSPIVAEIIADSGFDWILLDSEHSPNEIPDLFAQLQASVRGTATPIVRPPWNDTVMAKRCLDIGAQTLLFPYVQNAEEAKRAVESTRYPPQGVRGVSVAARASRFGRVPGYLGKANSEQCVLVQVETRSALDHLEAIAQVEGVDGVFIGPSDLPPRSAISAIRRIRKCRRRSKTRSSGSRSLISPPASSPATRKKSAAISTGATCSWRWVPTSACWPTARRRWRRSSKPDRHSGARA